MENNRSELLFTIKIKASLMNLQCSTEWTCSSIIRIQDIISEVRIIKMDDCYIWDHDIIFGIDIDGVNTIMDSSNIIERFDNIAASIKISSTLSDKSVQSQYKTGNHVGGGHITNAPSYILFSYRVVRSDNNFIMTLYWIFKRQGCPYIRKLHILITIDCTWTTFITIAK